MVNDGVQLDLTRRKAILSGLEYLLDNLSGARLLLPNDQKRRPRRSAGTMHRCITRSRLIRRSRVKVFKRQGRLIYPEQERIFRRLDRSAIQGDLSRGELERADKVLRIFKAPGTLDRSWARAELLADQALSQKQ